MIHDLRFLRFIKFSSTSVLWVLRCPAFGFQFVADGVGAFEIFRFARQLDAASSSAENFRRNFCFRLSRRCRRTESILSHAAKCCGCILQLSSEFSRNAICLLSRIHSKTTPHAAETFKSSSSAAGKLLRNSQAIDVVASAKLQMYRQQFRASLPTHSSIRASAVRAPSKPSSVKLNVSR